MPEQILQSSEKQGFSVYAVETKGEKEYFVEGYIATYDKDLVNDVITKSAMQDIYDQADVIKFDVEHEAFKPSDEGYGRFGSRDALIPVAKVVAKKMDDTGVWVKAKLNHHISKFKGLWGSLQDRFVTAFSIAFAEPNPEDYIIRKADGARLLHRIRTLLNVAFTGNPINRSAGITSVVAKSRDALFQKPEEESNMDEEKEEVIEEKPEEAPVEKPVEAPEEELKEDVPAAEVKALIEEVKKQNAEIKSLITNVKGDKEEEEEDKKEEDDVVAELKAIRKENTEILGKLKEPVLKAEAPQPDGELAEEGFSQFIR